MSLRSGRLPKNLGWFHTPSREQYDLAIYGAGPAGLSAAGLCVVGRPEDRPGGALGQSGGTSRHQFEIENYLGFPQAIRGVDLAERGARTGVQIRYGDSCWRAEGVRRRISPWGKRVGYLEDGTKIVVARAGYLPLPVSLNRKPRSAQ